MTNGFDRLYEGAAMRAYRRSRGADKVVVTFDHWRHDRAGFPERMRGTGYIKRGFDLIRIDTAANDWFCNADRAQAFAAVGSTLAEYRRCIFIGFSMGAFGALALARAHVPLRLIAVSPVFPPAELLGQEGAPTDGAVTPVPQALIQFDPQISQDTAAAHRFASAVGGAALVACPGSGHPTTQELAALGTFDRLLDPWLAPKLSGDAVRQVHDDARAVTRILQASGRHPAKASPSPPSSPEMRQPNKRAFNHRHFGQARA